MTDASTTGADGVTRYAPYSDAPSGDGWMDYHPHGEWVRFTDYQALRERAEAAEQERDAARDESLRELMALEVAEHCRAVVSQACHALKLHVAYEAMPADRGGKNGPKARRGQHSLTHGTAPFAVLPPRRVNNDNF